MYKLWISRTKGFRHPRLTQERNREIAIAEQLVHMDIETESVTSQTGGLVIACCTGRLGLQRNYQVSYCGCLINLVK